MKHPLDWALLGLAVAGFGVSLLVSTDIVTRAGTRASSLRTVAFSGGDYSAPEMPPPPADGQQWRRPEFPRTRGKWIFDLFTPPLVRWETGRGAVVMAAPRLEAEPNRGADCQVPLELIAVRRRPDRFRLAGFAGTVDRPVVMLEDSATGQTILLRSGATDDALGLEVRRLTVRRIQEGTIGGADLAPEVATAVVFDRRENREVVLTSAGLVPGGDLIGVFRLAESGTIEERSAGESLTAAGSAYVVKNLSLDPPAAELAAEDSKKEHTVLRLVPAARLPGPEASPGPSFPAPPNPAESSDEPSASLPPSVRAGPDGGDP
jgi:hypothetical protein